MIVSNSSFGFIYFHKTHTLWSPVIKIVKSETSRVWNCHFPKFAILWALMGWILRPNFSNDSPWLCLHIPPVPYFAFPSISISCPRGRPQFLTQPFAAKMTISSQWLDLPFGILVMKIFSNILVPILVTKQSISLANLRN